MSSGYAMNSVTSNSSATVSLVVKGGGERDWWRKKFSDSGDSDSSRTSKNNSSKSDVATAAVFHSESREQFPNHELEYVVDDYYDVTDFEDEDVSPRSGSTSMDDNSPDSDFEDDLELIDPKTDTSALEAKNGKDIQGIPWERLNFTREEYRESRLKQYKNYESLASSREDLEMVSV